MKTASAVFIRGACDPTVSCAFHSKTDISHHEHLLIDGDEVIGGLPQEDLLSILYLPVSVGILPRSPELVLSLSMVLLQKRPPVPLLCIHEVVTCGVDGDRVPGGEDADVRDDGDVAPWHAVTVRSNTQEEVHVPR